MARIAAYFAPPAYETLTNHPHNLVLRATRAESTAG